MKIHSYGLCGPDCKYRSLYEGSQSSLSDMANKQAGALSRVGRLRSGMIASIKQTFPTEFADAESKLGKRMSACDDEILLAYLMGFLSMPKTQTATRVIAQPAAASTHNAELSTLRSALNKAGVILPQEDNLELWAQSISTWSKSQPVANVQITHQVKEDGSPTPGAAPHVSISDHRIENIDGDDDLFNALFDEKTKPETKTSPSAIDVIQNIRLPYQEDSNLSEKTPEEVESFDDFDHSLPVEPLGDNQGISWDDLEEQDNQQFHSDFVDVDPDENTNFDNLFDEESRDLPQPKTGEQTPVSDGVEPETQTPTTNSVDENKMQPSPTKVTSATMGLLKPEIVTQPTKQPARKPAVKKSTPKVSRISAQRPGVSDTTSDLKAAAEAAGELNDDVRNKIQANLMLPRPVFTSDLINWIGSEELFKTWEQDCFSKASHSPVRFIIAKDRHKARGNLVIPYAKELLESDRSFAKSDWGTCIENLRGAKLYEVGVVLHRYADSIVTFNLSQNVLTLRINHSRGLVGVIVVLNAEINDETKVELGTALKELTSNRLNLIAVCTFSGSRKAVPNLADAAKERIMELDLEISTPIIASTSGDFVQDGGTSAISVL